MVSDIYLKQQSTEPPLAVQLLDSSGNPIDLTGFTVTFILYDEYLNLVVNSPADVTDAVNGKVQYNWVASDTVTAGRFWGQFKAVYPSGDILKLPEQGFYRITIERDPS